MKKIIILFSIMSLMTSCAVVDTSSTYNQEFTWGRSSSKPIYLSFRTSKTTPFYFMLKRDSKEIDYKLIVRWKSDKKGDILFNSFDTTLKFLVDNKEILTYKPVKRPKIVAFDLNSRGHEEEAVFSIGKEEFLKIAYAKSVSVELSGRNNTMIGYFSRHNTIRAFRQFAENSH